MTVNRRKVLLGCVYMSYNTNFKIRGNIRIKLTNFELGNRISSRKRNCSWNWLVIDEGPRYNVKCLLTTWTSCYRSQRLSGLIFSRITSWKQGISQEKSCYPVNTGPRYNFLFYKKDRKSCDTVLSIQIQDGKKTTIQIHWLSVGLLSLSWACHNVLRLQQATRWQPGNL